MALIAPMPPSVVEPKPKNFHLGPNNFTIGQDKRMTILSRNEAPTTHQIDYVPWGFGRAQVAVPPAPACIISRDANYFNTRESESHVEFAGRHDASALSSPLTAADRNKLRATNFKMDSDLNKFRLYDSTHKIDYPPKECHTQAMGKSQKHSSIPQGDPDKVKQHQTDYMQTFRGHDALANKPKRAPCLHNDPSSTTKGDLRLHGFDTSQKDDYRNVFLPPVQPYPPQRGGNIPEGDREKEVTKASTMWDSYPRHDNSAFNKGYDKDTVIADLGRTNYKERDGRPVDHRTTMKESFVPQTTNFEKFTPKTTRNHSDCPEGDDHPCREKERASVTTNRIFHGEKNAKKPHIVVGADIFTKSRVQFGDPAQMSDFYDTTMKGEFEAKRSDYKYERSTNNTKSDLPLHFYPGPVNESIYKDAYQDPETDRMKLHPSAEDNLRRSHISMPLTGEMFFTTEHKDKYKRKGVKPHQIDRHHLQRSSLPIGTLNQSIHLDGVKRKR